MAAKKPRPSGPSGQHRGVQVGLRAETAEQLDRWRRAAESDGRTLNGWIRWVLDRASLNAEKPLPGSLRAGAGRKV